MHMNQINLKLDKPIDELLNYLAEQAKIPKAAYAKELLLESLNAKMLPILLKDYEDGKIGLKKIIQLTHITPDDLLTQIKLRKIKCPITPEIDFSKLYLGE